jgi:predicted SnoaL-like aldol condensation-catalyzing enzyme
MRSPREVVELYNHELWNKRRYELAEELIAETVVRHEVGAVRTLTFDQARQRVVDTWNKVRHLEFTLLKVIADEELVSIVYECHTTPMQGRETVTSSIEVYRVVDGRICEVWNVAYAPGSWR